MAYFNAEYSKHNNTHKTLKFELQITSNAFENKLSLYDGFHMCDMSNST